MSHEKYSYRQIVTSTSVVGGATAVTILVGLIRSKVFALAIGPTGLGLIGVYTSIMATAAALAGMGMGFSGVRLLAAAGVEKAIAKRALMLATWPLALIGGAVLWIVRDPVARLVTGVPANGHWIGISAIGVTLTIVVATQMAVLQGLQRISDLARVKIFGALLATAIAVPAVIYGETPGLILAVIAIPFSNWLVAVIITPPMAEANRVVTWRDLHDQWRGLFSLGAVVMITGTMSNAALVIVRALIIGEGDYARAGLYQAAYTVSATNIALVLTAMAASYYPRLAEMGEDRHATDRLVDQQLRTALLLGSPLLVALVAAAPLVLQLLYSPAFGEAADLLRWQVAGDLFKLPGWAMGFVLVARRDSRAFFAAEVIFLGAYVAGTYFFHPIWGLEGVGFAYLVAYVLYSLFVIWRCRRHGVIVSGGNLVLLGLAAVLVISLIIVSFFSPWASLGFGLVATASLGIYAIREIRRLTQFGGPLEQF